jgi:hypothetical protein
MERLEQLEGLLERYQAQIDGLEDAIALAEAADRTRLKQRLADLREEMCPYEQEYERLKASGNSPAPQPEPTPPQPAVYKPDTWVGREALMAELTAQLCDRTHLLWITGISGVGKTMLGECLAVKTWHEANPFHWFSLEILLSQGTDFTTGAAAILAKLGHRDLAP